MRLLITGTDGYIGSLLAPMMLANGYDVVGLDTSYFAEARLDDAPETPFKTIAKDIRHTTSADLEGIDAVFHLAGLSNDALGMISRRTTYDVNHYGAIRLAQLARDAGVTRFVYSSSCSVYGRSNEKVVTEESRVDPQTDYAVSKMLDEREIGDLAGDGFSPTFLRNATAYGASPRMRFDLVVNDLAAQAWINRRIPLKSDGSPWRPIVHVLDICHAFLAALRAPREVVHNQIFNVGRTDENYQIREIATCIGEVFPDCDVSFGASDPDQRSYRVSFDKIAKALPQFRCDWDMRRGATQLRELDQRVGLTEDMFRRRPFTRLAQIRHLLDSGQIDPDFFLGPGLDPIMIFTETHLAGAYIVDVEPRRDHRGFFARTFCSREFATHGLDPLVAQANLSFNTVKGIVRGMHFQYPPAAEAKFVRCTRGAILDVIVDLRPESPTYLQHVAVELTAAHHRGLYVPKRFAHGYQVLDDDSEVAYLVSEFYAPETEGGLRHDDPRLAIAWPLPVSDLSDKDRLWPLLAEAGRDLALRMEAQPTEARSA